MSEIDPFRIRAHVPEFDLISEGYQEASDRARVRWPSMTDVAYGPEPQDRLDLFFPDGDSKNRPIHIFVHGGYWRANVKEDYAFVANTICAAGSIAAIVEYGRLPALRMESLVEQVRRGALWLKQNAASFGGDADAISASGHSAGAHLAFYLAARGSSETLLPPATATSLFLVSGVYDLQPIPFSFLQAEIDLRDDEVLAWSPLTSAPEAGTPMTIVVGEQETPPFREQAALLAKTVSPNSPPVSIAGADHMTIVRDMGDIDSSLGQLFMRFLKAQASDA
ncbi:alpha/beta hydrolase [Rhizobium rhizogenes]|uniref:alpha/beta hydrolase n=1 Tax=Rhizobium rhizogenes TaxID=359 RepID=UPI0022705C7B|nr:alpha/beta hydrolase [Rhizobium rhizogenes]